MSITLWTPDSGMSQIAYEGHHEFRDMFIPSPGKDDWGVDTLERLVRGPADLFLAYGLALAQGQAYKEFYLQSWRPMEHPIFPGWALSYKGFRNGVLPNPLPSSGRSELVSSLTATDISVSWHGKTIVSATKEIKYIAPQTVYRYISNGEPTTARYHAVRGSNAVQILDSRTTINYDDGSSAILTGSAPAGVATALFVNPGPFTIGPSFTPILGTPYYEAEESVQIKFPGS